MTCPREYRKYKMKTTKASKQTPAPTVNWPKKPKYHGGVVEINVYLHSPAENAGLLFITDMMRGSHASEKHLKHLYVKNAQFGFQLDLNELKKNWVMLLHEQAFRTPSIWNGIDMNEVTHLDLDELIRKAMKLRHGLPVPAIGVDPINNGLFHRSSLNHATRIIIHYSTNPVPAGYADVFARLVSNERIAFYAAMLAESACVWY